MPVVRVRQFQRIDERLMAGDEAVRSGVQQQIAGALELVVQVWPVAENRRYGLVDDPLRSLGLDDAGVREPDEQVSQVAGVEDAGVVDDDERHVHPYW